MPQLQAPQFFVTPNSLADINKVRVSDMPQVWSWKQKAQQAEDIGLADLMRAQQEEQQLSPIRVQQAGANLESTITGTEGKKLENEGKRMENKKTAANLDQSILTEAFELRKKLGEAEGKLFDLEVDKMLRSPDPNIQKQGRQLLDVSRKAIEEKRKAEVEWANKERELRLQNQGRMAEIGAQGANAKEVMQMQIDAGRFKKTDKNAPVSFEQSFTKLKKAHEKHAALIDAARMAMLEGNEALAQSYLARAEDLRPQAEAELRMLQKPGEVDLSQKREPGQPIPTVPQGSIAPKDAKKPDPLGIR